MVKFSTESSRTPAPGIRWVKQLGDFPEAPFSFPFGADWGENTDERNLFFFFFGQTNGPWCSVRIRAKLEKRRMPQSMLNIDTTVYEKKKRRKEEKGGGGEIGGFLHTSVQKSRGMVCHLPCAGMRNADGFLPMTCGTDGQGPRRQQATAAGCSRR